MKDLMTLKRKKKPRGCKRHSQPLTYFCTKCEIPVCQECTFAEHSAANGHTIQDLKNAVDEQRRTVEMEISEAHGTILTNMSQTKYLDAEISNLFASKEATLAHIDKTFDTYIQYINRRRNKLREQVNETHRGRRDTMTRQLDDLKQQTTRLSNAVEQCETAVSIGSISDMVSTKTMMRNKRTETQKNNRKVRVGPNNIKFEQKQGEDRFFSCLQELGKVLCDSMLPSIVEVRPHPSVASIFARISMTLYSYNGDKIEQNANDECPVTVEIKDPDDYQIRNMVQYRGNGAYDITYRPQISGVHYLKVLFKGHPIKGGDYIVPVQSNNPMMKFGKKGEKACGEFMYPRAVAVDKKNCVYVVDTGNCCIQKFSPQGEFIFQFQICKENDAYSGCGIALNLDTNVLLCTEVCVDSADLSSAHSVLFYSMEGQLIHRISDPVNMKRGLCVAVNSIGHIIVADFENNFLLIYDKHGRLIKKIGQAGSAAGHFNHPTFVCVGHDDRIIVSDADNNRIQVFDKDGSYMYHFGSKGSSKGKFSQPFGVGADQHGNVLVVDSGNKRIQVFKQDGTYVSSIESTDDLLFAPRGIAITPDGHAWVADRDNHCIKKFRYM
jgi:DNA-binding beta-propeller fold protein YncE